MTRTQNQFDSLTKSLKLGGKMIAWEDIDQAMQQRGYVLDLRYEKTSDSPPYYAALLDREVADFNDAQPPSTLEILEDLFSLIDLEIRLGRQGLLPTNIPVFFPQLSPPFSIYTRRRLAD